MRTVTSEEWKKVRLLGRHGSRKPVTLFYSGTGVELAVKASELQVTLNACYEAFDLWITIFVNGEMLARQMLQKGEQTITVFRRMNPEKVKEVRIVRDTEALPEDHASYIEVTELKTDGTIETLPDRRYSLEFIGDSITTGEGTYGSKQEEDWIPMFFSAYHNYAYMTAKELDASYRVISKGGWGIYCGWDNNVKSSIPSVYGKVCGLLKGAADVAAGSQEDYDFAANPVDAVILHLGTNDYSAFTQTPWVDPETGIPYQQKLLEDGSFEEASRQRFLTKALDTLKMIRAYNPSAPILWIYGMLGNGLEPLILETIATYQAETKDEKVYYLALPDTNAETVGSRFHPGYPAHKNATKLLVPKLRELLEHQ